MKLLLHCWLWLALAISAIAQDHSRIGALVGANDDTLKNLLLSLPTAWQRANLYYSIYPEDITLSNCVDGSIDTWRLRRCCTDQAAYAWQDTISMTVTDRITNWNAFPWIFAGTSKAMIGTDTVPHTVNLRIKDANNQIVFDWETTVELVPGDWSYTVHFLWWVETLRQIKLVNFAPGSYHLVADLRASGYQGVSIEVPFTIDYPTVVTENHPLTDFLLAQNYPNPFNSRTILSFSISEPTSVKLVVVNLLGQQIASLINEELQAGTYTVPFDASGLSSGIYIYYFMTKDGTLAKTMVLNK